MPSLLQHFAWIPLRIYMRYFCSLKINGLENITNINSNVIIACNHSSELDPLFIVAALPYFSNKLPLYFVSREKSFYKNSRLKFLYGGTFFRMMGAYPAYVGLNNYKLALRHHLDAINKGGSICIFPLGRKHGLNEYAKARGGISYLAKKTGIPIVPVLFEGMGRHSSKDYLGGKVKLSITFGKPIYSKDIFKKNNSLRDEANHIDHEKAAARLMKKIAELA